MTVYKIVPYSQKSAGARNLKKGLEELLGYEVEKVDTDYIRPSNVWLINWGAGYYRGLRKNYAENTRLFNAPDAIANSVNKVDFFRIMSEKDVTIPRYTLSLATAKKWLQDGAKIYCRTNVEGRDGQGIIVASTPAELVDCSLYTMCVPAQKEYRIHVFQNKPIFDLEKVHDNPTKEQCLVRSGKNGWEYTRHTKVPDVVKDEAVKVSKALKLDFCAVDVLYNTTYGTPVVLESNTAPELGPWTRAAYAKEFVALL